MCLSSSIVDYISAEIAYELLKKSVITLGKNKVRKTHCGL